MFNSNVLWILAAFVVYMGVMIAIGAKYMKSTKNSEDYFLGGRGLSGWVAALSAQASDMSGWDFRVRYMHLEPVRHGLLLDCLLERSATGYLFPEDCADIPSVPITP